jgi:hypothetical protein
VQFVVFPENKKVYFTIFFKRNWFSVSVFLKLIGTMTVFEHINNKHFLHTCGQFLNDSFRSLLSGTVFLKHVSHNVSLLPPG